MDTILRRLNTTSEDSSSSRSPHIKQQQLQHHNNNHLLPINMIFNSNGFYKFLARYSGRRRSSLKYIDLFISHIVCCLVIFSLFNVSEACSSRTIPKPRPPPTPTPRPNITFHTYPCPELYERYYCQNGGKCFAVRIGSDIISNCECPEGLGGVRCEFKQIDGSFLPTAPKTLLETASIASGATLAVIASIIFFCVLYYRYQQREKNQVDDIWDVSGRWG